MASSHPRQKRRIEVDVLFAPVPQALVLDTRVSAAAARLWSVLYVFRWNDTPPDFDKLAAAMASTERSVYRWCQELETTGWIGWDRNAGILDRFVVRMSCDAKESDTGVNSETEELIPRSNKLIPRSKRLTQVSEELTQVSISPLFDPLPMPQIETVSSDQKIQKIQNGGGGGRTLAFLIDQGIGSAEEFAHLPYDQTVLDYKNRRAAGQGNGAIVLAWRSNPPTETHHYEQQQRSIGLDAPDRRKPSERIKERPALPPGLKLSTWKKSDP